MRGVEDIRLHCSFWLNPKVLDLQSRLGDGAVLALLRLWSWVGLNRPDGRLVLTPHGVATVVGWRPGPKQTAEIFCETLIELRLLDKDRHGTLRIHDWDEYQTWALGSENRHRKARAAARTRWAQNYEKPTENGQPAADDLEA